MLKTAPSNLPNYKDGKGVWEQCVRPAMINLDRVMAHFAISLIYPSRRFGDTVVFVRVRSARQGGQEAGGVATWRSASFGSVRSRLPGTSLKRPSTFVVIHYGGLDFHTVLRETGSVREYENFKKKLLDTYKSGSLADITTLVTRELEGKVHRLDDLFVDEQRRIIGIVLQDRIEDYQRTFERLVRQDDDVLTRLGRMNYPIPGRSGRPPRPPSTST